MCGRYNILESADMQRLMSQLGIDEQPAERRNIAPGSEGLFVIERDGQRQQHRGIWSLLIEPKPDGKGYRPTPKFSTFNARSDRLRTSSLWKKRYLSQRAIIPASAFHEWVGKQCYAIGQAGQAMALGGLYELWRFGETLIPAYSVITLPPHPRFTHIHAKSLPLMLEPGDFDAWLDPSFSQVDAFNDLLLPRLRQPLQVTPVDSPRTLVSVGTVETLPADEDAI